MKLDENWWREYNQTPRKIMERELYEVHKGDWKAFLDNVIWDEQRPETKEERKLREIEEEFNRHPFKQWIKKETIK